ncbi:MAG TPA: hypothetical protein VGI82_06750, partial [Chitinophagaceae bacterium]
FINFGEVITVADFNRPDSDGKKYALFNEKLNEQFRQLVFEIDKSDIKKQKEILEKKSTPLVKVILFLPAFAGFLMHALLYLPIKNFTYRRTWNNDHFDAVLVALLLIIYPLYVALLTIIAFYFSHSMFSLLLIILLPFTAWSYTQLKPQLDKQLVKNV